jgi:hypothetical protein
VAADTNVTQNEAEKKANTITPGMIGAAGVVSKLLKKHLEAMLRKHSIDF